MPLDDETYLRRFALRDLGPEHFDHRGHLWMGWLHLNRFELKEAISRVCSGIRDLAEKFGAPEKFNHTLTEALMRIMAGRMQGESAHDFGSFLEANPDLLTDAPHLLARHYSAQRLNSHQAHSGWLEPDLSPLDR